MTNELLLILLALAVLLVAVAREFTPPVDRVACVVAAVLAVVVLVAALVR